MDLGLQGRVVAIAGSSRGIGLAVARAALAEGASITISGRDEAALDRAAAELRHDGADKRVHAELCDVATHDGARALVDGTVAALGGLDAVVLNAGTGAFAPGWDVPMSEWEQALRANLWSAQHVLEHALPRLVAQGAGSVVAVGSVTGLEATSAPIPYSAAKAALVAATKNLARALGRSGVRVNCVAPGNVLFEGGRWEERRRSDPSGVQDYIDAEVPLGRFAAVDEIADAVLFLLSERASFITGACLVVDGGQTRGFH